MRMILLAITLAACTTTYSNCPPIVQYDKAFLLRLEDEIMAMPDDAAAIRAINDYVSLRDQLRACQ